MIKQAKPEAYSTRLPNPRVAVLERDFDPTPSETVEFYFLDKSGETKEWAR